MTDEVTKSRRGVAKRADPRAVPGAAPGGHRAGLHRQVLGLPRRRRLPLCGLRRRAVRRVHKFESGTGWPSFTEPMVADAVEIKVTQPRHGARRGRLPACGGHLGHVFPDGPGPTGQRYCMNSCSLELDPIARRQPPSKPTSQTGPGGGGATSWTWAWWWSWWLGTTAFGSAGEGEESPWELGWRYWLPSWGHAVEQLHALDGVARHRLCWGLVGEPAHPVGVDVELHGPHRARGLGACGRGK